MANSWIGSVFHCVPLHSSPAGLRDGRSHSDLPVKLSAGEQLVRLPLCLGIEDQLDTIIRRAVDALH
jgi:dTDP-4-amino-4,6-dideoxygalactose transaminase